MSYLNAKAPAALGLSWSDVESAAKFAIEQAPHLPEYAAMAPDVIAAVKGLAQDPYLAETACQLRRLKNLNARLPPGPACGRTVLKSPADLQKGLGLRYVVTPLRAAVFAKQNPWTIPVALAAVLGIPFLLGRASKGR
jgi:hypothetical protein